SLPELRDKYEIDYKNINFILSYNNIHIRSISESSIKISQEKYKKTVEKKYGKGITNVSQSNKVKEKKKATFMEHYGVDNVWKLADYNKKCAELHPESHEIHMQKLCNGRDIFWNNITKEQLEKWKKKVSDGSVKSNWYDSSLESRFCCILNQLNISYTRQFHIKGSTHPYDFRLCDTKIIIEINGNYWHANPTMYSKESILNFPGRRKIKAEDIWNRDKKFIEFANKNNFKVIEIWESDMKNKNDDELSNFVIQKLNEIKNEVL
ncbi:MAG: hypothetical protein IKO36_06160, partial [Bacteroidaceae bacterium]|nr:hypothetical protein [Bacteroidaceae bacterium]